MNNLRSLRGIRVEERELYSHEIEKNISNECIEDFILKRAKLTVKRANLETTDLSRILEKDLESLDSLLEDGIRELREEIDNFLDSIRLLDALGRVIGLISRVIGLATGPAAFGIGAAVAGVERTALLRADRKSFHREGALFDRFIDTLPPEGDVIDGSSEDLPVEQVPVEEVLYGVELTPESLIITVATGGCTEEDSFHIDVNKGYTGLPPYLVTVYRVKPDDCHGNFEPIRIAFSRKDLGLEGLVEFRVLNRIGNTSNHRLLP